jgi:hypothetical protein
MIEIIKIREYKDNKAIYSALVRLIKKNFDDWEFLVEELNNCHCGWMTKTQSTFLSTSKRFDNVDIEKMTIKEIITKFGNVDWREYYKDRDGKVSIFSLDVNESAIYIFSKDFFY